MDEAICAHLQQPIDTDVYCHGWYDTIGFGLSLGYTWDELRKTFKGCARLLLIIDYLEEHYTAAAWYEHK